MIHFFDVFPARRPPVSAFDVTTVIWKCKVCIDGERFKGQIMPVRLMHECNSQVGLDGTVCYLIGQVRSGASQFLISEMPRTPQLITLHFGPTQECPPPFDLHLNTLNMALHPGRYVDCLEYILTLPHHARKPHPPITEHRITI